MKDILIVFLVFILVYVWYTFSGSQVNTHQHLKNESQTKEWVDNYINFWNKKEAIDSLMKYYNENSQLYDLIGDSLLAKGLEIQKHLPWGNSTLVYNRRPALNIKHTIIEPLSAMISGHLAPIQKGALVIKEEIPFITWVKFDTSGVILEQFWWQKYGN